MRLMNRRSATTALLAGLTASALPMLSQAQVRVRRYRMLLNTSFSGPQAWLLLAQDKGFLQREGLEIEFTQGAGAYTAAPRMVSGDFDFGYGDINSLIEVAAREPAAAPVAVFVAFNASPSTIALAANGPIRTPRDLEGKVVIGHSTDVALRTFGAFCKRTSIDPTRVQIRSSWGGMAGMVDEMRGSDGVAGVFGYVSTLEAALAAAGHDPKSTLRHFTFAEHVPDLYGSALMVSRRVLRDDPNAVAGFVRAFNAGLVDLVKSRDAGIDAVMRRVGGSQREVERLRLDTTMRIEMAHAEGKRLGIGDVDDARFSRSVALIAETNRLPRVPALRDIFNRDFLPPMSERVTSLAG